MDQAEERLARMEGMLNQIDKRLTEWVNHFDSELRQLRAELRQFEGRVEARFNSVDARFNQLFYAVITSWVAIIAALLVAIFKG